MEVTGPTDVPKHKHLIAAMNELVVLQAFKNTATPHKEALLLVRYCTLGTTIV